jgi:hypothetical protein
MLLFVYCSIVTNSRYGRQTFELNSLLTVDRTHQALQKMTNISEMTDRVGNVRVSFDRKLFRQRHVLDTLRLYLDVNDPLVADMHNTGLLNEEEIEFLQVSRTKYCYSNWLIQFVGVLI